MGCKHLYAVSNAGYYAMNHVRIDRKLKTSLDDFWQECEGQACKDQRFFEMPDRRIPQVYGRAEAV